MARRKILLIEADPVRKIHYTQSLQAMGYKTVVTASGAAALRALQTTLVDAVIIDLELTDMPGIHLLREMRKEGVEIPVILTGRDASKEELIMALRSRAHDFLQRPYKDEEMESALSRCLYEPEAQWSPPKRLDLENLVRAVGENRFKWPEPHSLALGLEMLPQDPENALQALVEGFRGHRQLQGQVLAELNGPRFPNQEEVSTLREAVRTYGPRMITFLIAERSLEPYFLLDEADDLHADVAWGMWECARMTAHLCLHLSKKKGLWDAEGLAYAGLVHNIGEVLTVRYEATLDKGNIKGKEDQVLQDLQDRIAECHEEVGRQALETWGASDTIVELAGGHHMPPGEDVALQDRIRRDLVMACWETSLRWGLGYFPSHDAVDPRPSLRALEIEPKYVKRVADRARSWLLPTED